MRSGWSWTYAHRTRFEPICTVLAAAGVQIAPSTYYAARTRAPSARAVRDQQLLIQIQRVHLDRAIGRGLYGARKVWHAMRREGQPVARCTVERLMRGAGLTGARRGRRTVTTRPDPAAARPPDLVERNFTAPAPTGCGSSTSPTSHLVRHRVHRLRDRRVLPADRQLAHRHLDAHALPLDALAMAMALWAPAAEPGRPSTGWCTTPMPAARADSIGRRNTP